MPERRLLSFSHRKAGDGTRTRDIQLGKLTLYQLSYTRVGRDTIATLPRPRVRRTTVRKSQRNRHFRAWPPRGASAPRLVPASRLLAQRLSHRALEQVFDKRITIHTVQDQWVAIPTPSTIPNPL